MTPEQLETRWVTAQGREILQRVIADLHDEGGLNLPAILGELEGTPEIQDGLDLRYAPLEGEHLEEVNLYAVNLEGAFLAGARLHKADIRDANLSGAILDGCDLRGAYLSNTSLARSMLKNANLAGAMLDGADLSGALLTGAVCTDTYFSGARLEEADLRNADLTQADFTNARARGATVSAGGLDRVAVPPLDMAEVMIQPTAPPRPPRTTMRRGRPPGPGATSGMRRPQTRRGQPGTVAMRHSPPGTSSMGSRAQGRPGGLPPNNANGAPLRDWDMALAKLIPLRRSCSRIVVIVDGREQVLFEA